MDLIKEIKAITKGLEYKPNTVIYWDSKGEIQIVNNLNEKQNGKQ
jgi:hypothetical protein